MLEFDVTITHRPLGVRFAHADHGQTVVVHKVLEDKLGATLGLEPGDILVAINGDEILGLSSAEALEKFRKIPTPYTAKFRRIEDDDTFATDDEDADDSQFLADDAQYLMHTLSAQPYHRSMAHVNLEEWVVDDVLAWVKWWSKNLGEPTRFDEYIECFRSNAVDGKKLKVMNEDSLRSIGVIDDIDIRDLLMGIQDVRGVNGVSQNQQARQQQQQQANADGGDDDDDDDDAKDEDDPDWEAPFLPYLYDAPTVNLTPETKVQVSSARIVAPYKNKSFALYEIDVSDGENEWLLSKRFSEFWRLYQAMKKLGIHTTAKFPPRRLFNSTEQNVIEARKGQLTRYLQDLLENHPNARNSKELNEFLSPSRTFVVDA